MFNSGAWTSRVSDCSAKVFRKLIKIFSKNTNQEISDGQDTDETSDSSSGSDGCDENDDGEENGNSKSYFT